MRATVSGGSAGKASLFRLPRFAALAFGAFALWAAACGALRAEASPAAWYYGEGMRLEKAGDYVGALRQFRHALVVDPAYFWADRGAGNCAYKLGDFAEALRYYRRYLDYKPGDVQYQAFADQLRARLREGEGRPLPPNWQPYLALDGGGVSMDATDLQNFASGDEPGVVNGPSSVTGGLGDLEFGFTHRGFLDLFFRFDVLSKEATINADDGFGSEDIDLADFDFVVGSRYRWNWGRNSLAVGADLGVAELVGTATVTDSNGNQTASLGVGSSAFVFDPQALYEFHFSRHWSIRATVGYRVADFTQVQGFDGSGGYSGLANPLRYANGSDASFNDSGPFAKLGLVVRFGRSIY